MPENSVRGENKPTIDRLPSETAMATATMRALAAHDERKEIRGRDTLAEVFLTEDRKAPLMDPALRAWVLKNKTAPGMYEFMIARTAFFDEMVERALRQNTPQIVFLGAGYDSRPYRFRDLIQETRLFELDVPPTQQRKKEMLRQANIPVPGRLTYIPINFNTEDFGEVLDKAGFSREKKTLFVWEGVMYYLAAQVVDDTFNIIRSNSPAGSSVCFDYAALSPEGLQESGVKKLRELMKSGSTDEPTRFGIPKGTIEAFLSGRGFHILKHLTPENMEKQYLTLEDGSSAGKLPGLFCFVHAAVAG